MRLATLQPPLLSPPTGISLATGRIAELHPVGCLLPRHQRVSPAAYCNHDCDFNRTPPWPPNLGLRHWPCHLMAHRRRFWALANLVHCLETCQLQAEVDTLPTAAIPGEATTRTALPVASPVSEWEIVTEERPRFEPRPADSGSSLGSQPLDGFRRLLAPSFHAAIARVELGTRPRRRQN